MDRALALAATGLGLTSPNPAVGAVLVRDGLVAGEGAHARAGGPHAEAMALAAAGDRARGATCYVTLEPCAHRGRTPPCADALVAAGVSRAVVACRDPNPLVDGRGLARLRAAGVEVVVGVREAEARALNRGFFCFVTRGRPHVTLKSAMTLDGKIAAFDGESRWITGEAARQEAHRMRRVADAILAGIGTVLRDDPQLTVRLPSGVEWGGRPEGRDVPGRPADLVEGAPLSADREPWRVIVDSGLRIPPGARVLKAGTPGRTVVACVGPAPADRAAALRAHAVRVLEVRGDAGRVDLRALLEALATLGVVAVLAEGGSELGGSLVEAGLVDRVAFFIAPRLLGGRTAPGPVGGAGRALKDTLSLTAVTCRQIGEDWLVEGDVEH